MNVILNFKKKLLYKLLIEYDKINILRKKSLEGTSTVPEAEQHLQPLKKAKRHNQCGFWNVSCRHLNMIVSYG